MAQSFHVHDKNVAQQGQVSPSFQDLVHLLLVVADHEDRIAMANDVGRFLGGVGGIDPHGHGSGALSSQVGVKPFGLVVAKNADMIALVQAQSHHAQAEIADVAVIIVPGYLLPDPEILFP